MFTRAGQPWLLLCDTVCGGGVWEGTMSLALLLAGFHSLPYYPQANLALLVLIPGGWVSVCPRTLWVSPTNSPVRLGVFPTTATPIGFYSQSFWSFLVPHLNSGLPGLSLPSCSSWLIHTWMPDFLIGYPPLHPPFRQPQPCCLSSLPWLPVSTPPTSLNEWSLFSSLVDRLPHSSFFWQFLFLCF